MITVSIVIASLGRRCLAHTLDCIFESNQVNANVIVVLPKGYDIIFPIDSYPPFSIFWADKQGQVAQRAYGLKKTVGEYVIQMDDDISFTNTFLERFISKFLELREGDCVAAPLIRCSNNGSFDYQKQKKKIIIFLDNLIDVIIFDLPWGAKKNGRISNGNKGIPVDPEEAKNGMVEAEWLPGGCVISQRKNLVLEDFYPFHGKAFSEDLLHSRLRQNKRLKHFVFTDLYVFTDEAEKKEPAGFIEIMWETKCFLVRNYKLGLLLGMKNSRLIFVQIYWISRLSFRFFSLIARVWLRKFSR